VQADPKEVERQLIPVLRSGAVPPRDRIAQWSAQLVADCRELLSVVLPLAPTERDFLDRLNGCGEIIPELLTDELHLQDLLRMHPGLLWKALNVRKHLAKTIEDSNPGDQ